MINKAKRLIDNPGFYTKATSYGAASYVHNISFDKKTDEIVKKELSLDWDKIKEEEKYDGYYAIVSSEIDKSAQEIRDIYSGLWKIEETFKITKSEFEARPVYL